MTRSQARLFWQAITLFILAYSVYSVVNITAENLERLGIVSGFDFLWEKASFEVSFSLWDYSSDDRYIDVFWVGVGNTILASFFAIVFCTFIGLFIGVAQLSSNQLTATISRIYVETFRNVPVLLNIFFWYFLTLNLFPGVRDSLEFGGIFLNQRGLFLPKVDLADYVLFICGLILVIPFLIKWLVAKRTPVKSSNDLIAFAISLIGCIGLIAFLFNLGIFSAIVELPRATRFNISGGIEIVPELFALVVGLSIYHGAFVAEIVRGGILAVPKGQSEAALSSGLSSWQTMRLVIIPQALKIIIPPYINNNLFVMKNSSLGAAIAFPELVNVFAGTALNQTGSAIEIILMCMLVYFVISMVISIVMNIYNKYIQLVER